MTEPVTPAAYTSGMGPPCKEAKHTWSPGTGRSTSTNLPTFGSALGWSINDQGVGTNFIKLIRAPGFYSLGEADDNREQRLGGIGELTWTGYPRGKTIVYECELRDTYLQGLHGMSHTIRQGFSERNFEGKMLITPYSGWGGGQTWSFYGRVLDLTIDEDPVYNPGLNMCWRQGCVITFRLSNPRFFVGDTAPSGTMVY